MSGGVGGARAPPEFVGSEKGQNLISAYRSVDITMNTPGFKKLSTALFLGYLCPCFYVSALARTELGENQTFMCIYLAETPQM